MRKNEKEQEPEIIVYEPVKRGDQQYDNCNEVILTKTNNFSGLCNRGKLNK
jgi:hypothetical protein